MDLVRDTDPIGVAAFPVDWQLVEVGSLHPFVTSGSRGWAGYYADHGSPFIRITNLTRESIRLDLADLRYVRLPKSVREGTRTELREGDVLISITADIGIIGCVTPDLPTPAYINQHLALVRFDPSRADGQFVAHYLAADRAQSVFRAWTDTGAKKGMSLLTIKALKIPLPPLPEQRAITTALTGIDRLVVALERLIVKKRGIRQGVAHQLLTGAVRLPGFEAEWPLTRFSEMFTTLRTANNPRADLGDTGDIGYVHYGDIHSATSPVLDSSKVSLPRIERAMVSRVPRLKDGDLVIADASEDYAGVGKAVEVQALASREVVGGLHTIALRGTPDVVAEGFRAYLQFIPEVRAALIRLATGISVFGISKSGVMSIEVRLPPPEEQRAIVALLSDLDSEIEALEARLAKTKDLKSAMAQELLSGRTRLV